MEEEPIEALYPTDIQEEAIIDVIDTWPVPDVDVSEPTVSDNEELEPLTE